jgi:hypothetical protein
MQKLKTKKRVCLLAAMLAAHFGFLVEVRAFHIENPDNPTAKASTEPTQNVGHEMYLSWGYHTETYLPVELRLSCPL